MHDSHIDQPHRSALPLGGHAYLLWPAVGFLAFWQIAPRINGERISTILLSTILSLCLVVVLAAGTGRALRSWRSAAFAVLASALVILPLRVMLAMGRPGPPWSWTLSVAGLADLAFVVFGASLGALLSRLVRTVNLVPPVAAVLVLVDVWTVLLGGPVQRVMSSETETARRVTEAMTVRLPAPTSGAAPLAVVGFADFVFIAFFVAAMCRFAGPDAGFRRTVWPLVVVLSAYMLVVLVTDMSLPALVPMAVTVVAIHWRQFEYARSELFALLYAALFVIGIAVAFWLIRVRLG